jgi:hypothetical protein
MAAKTPWPMSTPPYPSLASRAGAGHPTVLSRRARERLLLFMTALIPLVLALAISVATPHPSVKEVIEVVLLILGAVGVVVLMASVRYTVSLTLLVLYLGLLDGPVKLEAANKLASGFRDILIVAIALGMLMRASAQKTRLSLPPLAGWVVGFVAVALVEALNPDTHGFLKALGGYRQQLEFVPFFFFGYLMMRSKHRFRQLFLIFGVLALANGLVGAYQSRLSPSQLSGWGPGYGERVNGKGGQTGRTYAVEGVAHPRPPALGSDSGFGGGIGVLALPGLLALLTSGRLRRRWPVVLCCMGAVAGIATSASRTSIVVALVVVAGYAGLSLLARLRLGRPLAALLALALVAGAVGWALQAADGSQVFHRQESLLKITGVTESAGGRETGGDGKEKHLNEIPRDMLQAPFGLGLGVSGSVAGFGGHEKVTIENEKVSGAGSAFNLLVVELGAPGLFLWIGLTIAALALVLKGLRCVVDPELRVYLVAMVAAYLGYTAQGFVGPTLAVTPAGVYLWFVPGVIAYWFAGPGRTALRRPSTVSIAPALGVGA